MEQLLSYIEDREAHHRRTTFEEEFVSLLRTHHITFGLQYLWAQVFPPPPSMLTIVLPWEGLSWGLCPQTPEVFRFGAGTC